MQSILGLAVLEARSGRPRMALKMYMRGLQIEPGNVQLLHASAQLLKQQGQQEVDSCPNSHVHMFHTIDPHLLHSIDPHYECFGVLSSVKSSARCPRQAVRKG